MTNEKEYNHMSAMSLKLAQNTDVSTIAKDWEDFFYEFLEGKQETVDRSLASIRGK